ncbi:MAG: 3-deoxy-manno-octulosonate cytidylyltransferase [Pseudomonadota bacterium]
MSALAIIPARFASTRLPGKPLLSETGKPLIQHVYEQVAAAACVSRTVVATDDDRIRDAVARFGGEAVMTRTDHLSGTERIAEAARRLDVTEDVILNVQGDEPEIAPAHLDALAALQRGSGAFAATLACPFPSDAGSGAGSPLDPSCVKVVLRNRQSGGADALYFSRSLVPSAAREEDVRAQPQNWLLHIGVYAFSPETLQRFAAAPASSLERAERLEQMRILEMGERIAVALVDAASPGVDTPADYAAFVARQGAARR